MEEEAPEIPTNNFLGDDRLRFGEKDILGGPVGEPPAKKAKSSSKKEKDILGRPVGE